MVLAGPFWTNDRGKDTLVCLLSKPNIVLTVKGEMLKIIAFIILE